MVFEIDRKVHLNAELKHIFNLLDQYMEMYQKAVEPNH